MSIETAGCDHLNTCSTHRRTAFTKILQRHFLVFYAQSTITVISGRTENGSKSAWRLLSQNAHLEMQSYLLGSCRPAHSHAYIRDNLLFTAEIPNCQVAFTSKVEQPAHTHACTGGNLLFTAEIPNCQVAFTSKVEKHFPVHPDPVPWE